MTSDLREQVLGDPTIPETIRDALENGLSLEEICLDRFGSWWHGNERITHQRIIDLFGRSVDVTDGGTYVLRIQRFCYPISVQDTPFFVVRLDTLSRPNNLFVHLNDGSKERLRPETLRHDGQDRLVARIKDGRFEARFLRSPYHQLLDALEMDPDGRYFLRLGDRSIGIDLEL